MSVCSSCSLVLIMMSLLLLRCVRCMMMLGVGLVVDGGCDCGCVLFVCV